MLIDGLQSFGQDILSGFKDEILICYSGKLVVAPDFECWAPQKNMIIERIRCSLGEVPNVGTVQIGITKDGVSILPSPIVIEQGAYVQDVAGTALTDSGAYVGETYSFSILGIASTEGSDLSIQITYRIE